MVSSLVSYGRAALSGIVRRQSAAAHRPLAAPAASPPRLPATDAEVLRPANGLAAAVDKIIARHQPKSAAEWLGGVSIDAELAADPADDHRVGLAKAVARRCLRQHGAEKASAAIEYARALKCGVQPAAMRTVSAARAPGRVLSAVPRR